MLAERTIFKQNLFFISLNNPSYLSIISFFLSYRSLNIQFVLKYSIKWREGDRGQGGKGISIQGGKGGGVQRGEGEGV